LGGRAEAGDQPKSHGAVRRGAPKTSGAHGISMGFVQGISVG